VCKPESHQTLYDYLNLQDLQGFSKRHWNGCFTELHTYRFATDLPLRDSHDALELNWCELSIHREDDHSLLYHNSFATDLALDQQTVSDIITWGRARWKTEIEVLNPKDSQTLRGCGDLAPRNENNNTLKTKGYNFEHNYGHGQQHLSTLLLSLLLLSFS
jgi:hypothetical protein